MAPSRGAPSPMAASGALTSALPTTARRTHSDEQEHSSSSTITVSSAEAPCTQAMPIQADAMPYAESDAPAHSNMPSTLAAGATAKSHGRLTALPMGRAAASSSP